MKRPCQVLRSTLEKAGYRCDRSQRQEALSVYAGKAGRSRWS
jgi:hypothetical protein